MFCHFIQLTFIQRHHHGENAPFRPVGNIAAMALWEEESTFGHLGI